jgi:hypothetical protein
MDGTTSRFGTDEKYTKFLSDNGRLNDHIGNTKKKFQE